MPQVYRTIQNSFSGGEFSTIMDARQDLQKYGTGLAVMKNFYIKPQGAAVNRPGTYFIAEVKDSSKPVKLLPFVFSESISYSLEFGDHYVRFYRNGGQIVNSDGTPYEISTPYSADEVFALKTTQSADVLYIAHPNHKPMTLSRTSDTSWTIAEFSFKLGPFAPMDTSDTTITPSGTTGNITLTASAGIFTADHIGSLIQLESFVPAQATYASMTASGSTGTVWGQGTWLLTTHGTWAGRIYVEKTTDGSTYTALRNFSANSEYNVDTSGTENDGIVGIRVRLEFTSGTCNIDLQFEPFTNYGIAKITGYTDSMHVSASVQQNMMVTIATTYWYWGAWNDVRGYPAAVVFFQNRLVFGYTKTEPQTTWSSQTGDYKNYGVSYVSADSDAITTSLVSEKVNAIRSLKALSKILAFTAGGYWVIGSGGDSDAFTPSNEMASAEGMFGAADINPLIIGNRILFVGSKGNVVRDAGYDIQSEAYIADDITLYSTHLFDSRSIKDWAYAQDPDSIVWAIRDDGVLLSMTYIKEQQVCAWARHTTDGLFESVCVIPGSDKDYVYVVVNRTINGVTKRYVEMFADRTTDATEATNARGETYAKYDPADQFFVDCGLSYNGTAKTEFSGLSYLEGKTVSILADGNVQPQQTVVNGKITLTHSASKIAVGLPYTCDIETLNADFQAQIGTIQGMKKTIKKIILRVDNSRGLLVGGDFNNMYELKMRSTENYGNAIALYTGDLSFNIPTGSNIYGRVCIRVKDPLPCNLLAVISEVALDG